MRYEHFFWWKKLVRKEVFDMFEEIRLSKRREVLEFRREECWFKSLIQKRNWCLLLLH